jgi:hypothetical protein
MEEAIMMFPLYRQHPGAHSDVVDLRWRLEVLTACALHHAKP